MDPMTLGILGGGVGGALLLKAVEFMLNWKSDSATRKSETGLYSELAGRIQVLEAARIADEQRISELQEVNWKYREALTLMRLRIRILEAEFKKTGHPLPEIPYEFELEPLNP